MNKTGPGSSYRIDILDYARFVAALAVVFFHYAYYGIKSGDITGFDYINWISNLSQFGYVGVELFFMISGYVIFFSFKGRTAAQFAKARVKRLYPAFLISLLLTSTFIIFFGGERFKLTEPQFLANLTMIPGKLGFRPLDGSYWTLTLEIEFYSLIFLSLLFGLQKQLVRFLLAWPIFILIAMACGFDELPVFGGYFSYFAAGSIFAMKKSSRESALNVLIAICYVESILYSSKIHSGHFSLIDARQFPLLLSITGFYLFFYFFDATRLSRIELPFAKLLGAVSYPLYLIHQTIGYIALSHIGNQQNKVLVLFITLASSLIVAYLINRYIEIHFESQWNAVFERIVSRPISFIEASINRLRDLNWTKSHKKPLS